MSGHHINLINGRVINPVDLRPQDIDAEAAIHALSILNRYGGHTIQPYSVAEHTVHLIHRVPFHLRRAALIHEFPEGLGFVDLPRPVKHQMPEYDEMEKGALRRVCQKYAVDWGDIEELHEFDQRICQDEMQQVFPKPVNIGLKPLGVRLHFWSWSWAKRQLLEEAKKLGVIA